MTDSRTPGRQIIAASRQALAFARGEEVGARVTVVDIPNVPAIRGKLGFTQREFALRFGVSLGTLRNWEQGVRIPEGPARALLQVIDREPDAVKRALAPRAPKAKAGKKSAKRAAAPRARKQA